MNLNMNLATSCTFRGREYLINVRTMKQSEVLEIKVTDKKTSDEWLGSYNPSYIESLTHKTGNYKRFDTFISMLKSGLLGTSHCVTLDLLTFEDLEMLRSRASHSRSFNMHSSHIFAPSTNNRRYLILTYTVEFDRIHYPLALEYSGPPDPRVLQETIQRLEKQIADLQYQLSNNDWGKIKNELDAVQKKVVDVTAENIMLKEQIYKLTNLQGKKFNNKEIDSILNYTYALENKLQFERTTLEKVQKENFQLAAQLEVVLKTEKKLRDQLGLTRHPYTNDSPRPKLKETKFTNKVQSFSPKRDFNTINCAEKPFSRRRSKSEERKVCSARSCVNIIHSSSEESVAANQGKSSRGFRLFTPPRSRASSPSFSDISHNSEISRCVCRNCLHTKFMKNDQSVNYKTKEKGRGKAKLLKRIQSLEKLISGIVLN